MMTVDDALRQARKGDIDAYEVVVRETAPVVRGYLSLFIRDAETVNDLAQETFLYAYEHLGEFTPGTDFRAYLRTIARTRGLKAWRERQRKAAAHQRYASAVRGRMEADLERREEREPAEGMLEKLRGCLERLGGHASELVRLRYFENRPMEEIARAQGKTVNNLSVILCRVRNQLGECMERSGS